MHGYTPFLSSTSFCVSQLFEAELSFLGILLSVGHRLGGGCRCVACGHYRVAIDHTTMIATAVRQSSQPLPVTVAAPRQPFTGAPADFRPLHSPVGAPNCF